MILKKEKGNYLYLADGYFTLFTLYKNGTLSPPKTGNTIKQLQEAIGPKKRILIKTGE